MIRDFHMMACLHSVVVNISSDPNLFICLMQRFCLHPTAWARFCYWCYSTSEGGVIKSRVVFWHCCMYPNLAWASLSWPLSSRRWDTVVHDVVARVNSRWQSRLQPQRMCDIKILFHEREQHFSVCSCSIATPLVVLHWWFEYKRYCSGVEVNEVLVTSAFVGGRRV